MRFLPAILLSLFIMATAPFVGVVRKEAFERFPRAALGILATTLLVLAVVALVHAVRRIHSHRALRYGGLVLVVVLVWILYFGFSDPNLAVNVIEKVHIFEYGLLAFLLYRALLRGPRGASQDLGLVLLPLLGVTVAGTLDEWTQWIVPTRMGYIADIWLNIFSGVCGLIFSFCLDPPASFRWRLGDPLRVGDAAVVAIVTVGLFFYNAHLGYLIEDPEIGGFYSWHSREELIAARADRARSWAEDPPTGVHPASREDLFLTEAGWHSRYRYFAQKKKSYAAALRTNLILEKYYGPYLDLEGFIRPGKRRLSPERLRELEAAAATDKPLENFVSPAFKKRIRTWPKRTWLAGLAGIVAVWGLLRIAVVARSTSRFRID